MLANTQFLSVISLGSGHLCGGNLRLFCLVSGNVFTPWCSVYNAQPLFTFHAAIYHQEQKYFMWKQVVLMIDSRVQSYKRFWVHMVL